jgi:AraC family transcriptional regulator
MDPVAKALWFIESRFAGEISLDAIAAASGVSRYHLARVFGIATGRSVMRYVRGRRLSQAARALAGGAPDILSLALESGYGSHEAFTRAFRDQFGQTPEAVRARRDTCNLALVEPIRMDDSMFVTLEQPRFETRASFLVAGLGDRYTCESAHAIPALWQRFTPHYGNVPNQVGKVAYGVSCNADGTGNFDYIAGVEVSGFDGLPKDFARIRFPQQKYAVFTHRDHISTVRSTFYTIWNKWLPESGLEVAETGEFERYDERFDPRTGAGGLEIWIPVKG